MDKEPACIVGSHEAATEMGLLKQWNIEPSLTAKTTRNPLRFISHGRKLSPNPEKAVINLTIGDPTIHNLRPAKKVSDVVVRKFTSGEYHGYADAKGSAAGRAAVASYYNCIEAPLTADDVILTVGCSQALDLVFGLLAGPGDNILVPCPGYIYQTLSSNRGVTTKMYNLLPAANWEIDFDHLEAQVDNKSRAILINNPSNPCGSLIHRQHLELLLKIAEKHRLPIVSDEVYEHMVFKDVVFHPIATLSQHVPVFTIGGLSKRFCCPGWRMGWILVHNRDNILPPAIKDSLIALTEVVLGPCCFIQASLPEILADPPTDSFESCVQLFETNARHVCSLLAAAPGLRPIMPQGSMFMMIGIDCDCYIDIKSDVEFVEKLLGEESVFCIPSMVFNYPGYVRIVLAPSEENIKETCSRMLAFSYRHQREIPSTANHAPFVDQLLS